MTSMCRFAISHRNYYWRYVDCNNPQYDGACEKDPLTARGLK